VGKIVELSGAGLRYPDIHRAVAIGEKRYKVAVAGDGGSLCYAIEVREGLESGVCDRASPEVLGPLKPENYTDGQSNDEC
jgi:hypothetical protein